MAIQYIIKRNGSKEKFNPEKLNQWGQWASDHLGAKLDWAEVILHAYSTNSSEVTSRALQESLIDFCLIKGTWAYNRMAGRLYISLLYKDIFKQEKPHSLLETHKLLLQANLISDKFFNAYSEEDYKELENIIDHSMDLTYAHFQIKQILFKYSLNDKVNNILYESPQQVYMRVAMRICQNKGTGFDRLERVKRHYKMYSQGVVNIPTPYFTTAGTHNNGLLSCNLFTATDNVHSLSAGDHIAYMMTVGSAGQGGKLYTRSFGSPVKGGSIIHSGKIQYYRSQVAMVNANTQSGRGGSETQYYDCFDPEWETIQKFKNQMTPLVRQVRGMDYAMCFNSFFLNKAAKNEKVALLNFMNFPDLYEAMCLGDTTVFKNLYDKYETENKFDLYENARKILTGALKEGLETGRHYLCNLTELNRHTPFKDKIRQSNLCIAGNQYVISDKGLLTAKELYDLGEDLVLFDGIKTVKSSKMKLRQTNQDVYKITLKNGMSHTVTDYHKVMTTDGLVECKDLITNESKIIINTEEGLFGSVSMEDEAYLLGLYQGDGTSSIRDDSKHIHICLWQDKTEHLKDDVLECYKRIRYKYTKDVYELRNSNGEFIGNSPYTSPKFTKAYQVGNKTKWTLSSSVLSSYLNFEKNIIPLWIREGTKETQIAYVKGLFQTNGTYSYDHNANYISVTHTSKSFLEELQILLNNLGYNFSLYLSFTGGAQSLPDSNRNDKLYLCKDSYRLVASSFYTCLKFEEDTDFISFRNKTLPEPVKPVYKPKNYSTVVSVEYVGKEDVYCPTVESEEHLFVGNGIITKNCTEIALPTEPFESISDLYWPKYLESPNLTEEVKAWVQDKIDNVKGEVATCAISAVSIGKINSAEIHKEACWVALDMIHTAITETDYMLPHIGYTSKKRMSAGVGIMDLAHDLARRKLSYSSQEGRNYMYQVFESQYWWLLNASLELSKEFGNAEWIHKTKWADDKPWLPLDTYNKNINKLITTPLQYNWEEIRQRIKDNKGHAFSTLSAEMPGESSSIGSGTTNGLYPIRDISLRKSNETNSLDFVAPESDKYNKYYESAWDIPVKDILNMYALKQAWTDQTISADIWYKVNGSERINSSTLLDDFFYSQSLGIPTRYYTNSNTSKKIQLDSSPDIEEELESECEGCKM